MSKVSIFFTGSTGFIGGSVLDRLLSHPQAGTFHIAALVRSEAKATVIASLGVEPVVGSYTDLGLLKEHASKADFIISLADSDDVNANTAILSGMKSRFEKTGKISVLIHASGIGFLPDDAFGAHTSDVIWSDSDAASIEAIPATKFHRPVDTAIVQAQKEGYAKTFIIAPGNVYGTPSGRLVDLGIQQTVTLPVRSQVQFAVGGGVVLIPGEGKNIWACVHVDDCADLFYVLFKNALEGKDFGSGREGFYFAETGEHTVAELLAPIAVELHKQGKISFAAPVAATGEAAQNFFLKALGGNARCRGDRSRAAGWKPMVGDAGFKGYHQQDIKAAVEAL